MFRCLSLTFFGRIRTEIEHQKDESDALDTTHVDDNLYQPSTPYEQGLPVRVVLIILAALSAVSGLLGIPHSIGRFIGLPNVLESWLAPVFEGTTTATAAEHGYAVEYLLMLLSLGIAACGVVLATWLYTKRQDIIERLTAKFAFVYKIVFNKYYVDELYNIIIIRPLLWFNDVIKSFDQAIIDGLVNATASLGVFWSAVSGWWDWFFVDGAVNVVAEATITSGRKVRKLQTGKIQHYFYIILFGLIVMLIWSAI
jgi:NADH-quinone oxidoreductase subunit L